MAGYCRVLSVSFGHKDLEKSLREGQSQNNIRGSFNMSQDRRKCLEHLGLVSQ